MPLYKISQDRKALIHFAPSPLELENLLEGWIEQTPEVLGDDILIIARQVATEAGPIDLLALNGVGDLLIVELKRARAPRDVIAQALDYLSAVEGWDRDKIEAVAIDYFRRVDAAYETLEQAFSAKAGRVPVEEDADASLPEVLPELNRKQNLFIVAQDLGAATERMARFLCGKGIAVTCLAFTYYRTDSGEELLEVTPTVQPDTPVDGPRPPRGLPIDEEIFLSRCQEAGSELAIQLYERAKALTEKRRAQGDLIKWGAKGFSYSFAPSKVGSKWRPNPFWAFPSYFQIWVAGIESEHPQAGAQFRQALASIAALRDKVERERGPMVSFGKDPFDAAQMDMFIEAIERLGEQLDRERETRGGT